MSIRILPDTEIKQAASSFQHPPLLFANPKNLYQRRAKRLRQLAENHPFGDYLNFAAHLVDAQLKVLNQYPVPQHKEFNLQQQPPLDVKHWQRDPIWRKILTALLAEVKPNIALPQAQDSINSLEQMSAEALEALADKLLQQEFADIASDQALFIWAALSLYWLQLSSQLPHHSHKESGADLHLCPVCGSAPITSVVHFGAEQGLRYLHCALCESEWHQVRSKCTNCDESGKLDYWSLDSEVAAVKAESCGDCASYLKILYQEKDPNVEAAADDLASLFLDAEMEQKGFAKSGLNPYLFP